MPFLVVAGITVEVLATGAEELDPFLVGGDSTEADDGTLRSTTRGAKQRWRFTLAPMTRAAYATLKAAVPPGAIVACSGDALEAPTDCVVRLSPGRFVRDISATDGTEIRRQPTLVLSEV